MSEFWINVLPIALISFVSGITGAAVGTVTAIATMRTDIKWLKIQHERIERELETAHRRITRLGDNLTKQINGTRRVADYAKELVLKHMP